MAKRIESTKKGRAIKMKGLTEDEVNFSLLAIRSTEPETRMAWLLNRALSLDFIHRYNLSGREPNKPQQHTLLSVDKSEETRQFAVFHATGSDLHRTYILITNRQSGEALIKELGHVDYLLKIPDALPNDDLAALCTAIRAIPDVLACIAVTDKLKYNPLLASLEV
ncbi:MAG: IPExxxVDY family protein [Prevotellaceae bacterium]|jgi:hypothetical protein|nr:IPExxxVDY family protein [Prevotellaceae bacterium]